MEIMTPPKGPYSYMKIMFTSGNQINMSGVTRIDPIGATWHVYGESGSIVLRTEHVACVYFTNEDQKGSN